MSPGADSLVDTSAFRPIPKFWGTNGRRLANLVSVCATTGFLLFGYDQGVMSAIITLPEFNSYFPETYENETWQGFVTAIFEVGCLLGAIFVLLTGDKMGRRGSIITGASVMILGVIIQVSCVYPHGATAQFIIGRTITGVGNGMNTSTIPTYQSEHSRAHNRGLLICIEGSLIAVGSLIAYWIDFGSAYGGGDFTWRFPITFQVVFATLTIVLIVWLPESPRWLVSKDRHKEATDALAAVRGLSPDHPEIIREIQIISDGVRLSGSAGGNTRYRDLFTGGKTQHFYRMMLGVTVQCFQQLSGCNAVIYYFPVLFEESIGESHWFSTLMGGINMIVYAIFACTSWFLVDRLGRRKLFLIGAAGQCLSMVIVFACLVPNTRTAARGAAVGLFTYIAFFGATWLPLPWLYPAEVNPLKTRGKANAISTCSNWTFNFLIVMITPVMIGSIGWGTYLFFAAIKGIIFPLVYFFYPETKGRQLEEIDVIFAEAKQKGISVVTEARHMPYLTQDQIKSRGKEAGYSSSDNEGGQMADTKLGETKDDLEKYAGHGGAHMAA